MKTYAVFYSINGNFFTNTIDCFQYGEAYNWTIEDAAKEHSCKPQDVHIETIIEIV